MHQCNNSTTLTGVFIHFLNSSVELWKVTEKHNLPVKSLKTKKKIEKVGESNLSLAQITTIEPRYIWRRGVFNTPLHPKRSGLREILADLKTFCSAEFNII